MLTTDWFADIIDAMRICAAEGCSNKLHFNAKRSYCNEHVDHVICQTPGCIKPVVAYRQKNPRRLNVDKYCSEHRYSMRTYGSLDLVPVRDPWPSFADPGSWLEWIRRRTDVDEHGCWLWNGGSINPTTGYVNLGLPKGYPSNGHRLAYWAAYYQVNGCPPEMTGLQVDHLCHIFGTATKPRKHCLNPSHLMLRVPSDNSAEAVYRRARDYQVAELVTALHEVSPQHPLVTKYALWL